MSIVVDLAEDVSSRKLTAIKALRYRRGLFCLRVWRSRVLTWGPLNSYGRTIAASSRMLKPSARQSDYQSSSVAEPSQQLWTSAACPVVDHDARPEVSSSGRPPRRHPAGGHPAGRLDKKRGLVSSALVFGMLVKLISKENSVRFAFVYGRPNPKLRPQL
jgi:hypothetical protein